MKQTTYQSPADREKRVRRCARALAQGQQVKDLRRVYTYAEIEAAQEMLKGKK